MENCTEVELNSCMSHSRAEVALIITSWVHIIQQNLHGGLSLRLEIEELELCVLCLILRLIQLTQHSDMQEELLQITGSSSL